MSILVTGAAGFVGSSLVLKLQKIGFNIIALDIRKPSVCLLNNSDKITWNLGDFTDKTLLNNLFNKYNIDYVIHLAAYYDFNKEWNNKYETNIKGTNELWKIANINNVSKFIFSSSLSACKAYNPLDINNNTIITETTLPDINCIMAYGKSKAISERNIQNNAKTLTTNMKSVVIRFAGVFSDWVELPPIHSLYQLWGKIIPPFGNIIPGKGYTGMPFIHIKDICNMISLIINNNSNDLYQVYIASNNNYISQITLYNKIRQVYLYNSAKTNANILSLKPIYIPISILAKGNSLIGRYPKLFEYFGYDTSSYMPSFLLYEYSDKVYNVNANKTFSTLNWKPLEEYNILNRIPIMNKKFKEQSKEWKERNIQRNKRNYLYKEE